MANKTWLGLKSIRLWLFVALLVTLPLSKYPSIATPVYNFPSFRLGLYQTLLILFVGTCIRPTIRHIFQMRKQQKWAIYSALVLLLVVISGPLFALSKPRSLLLSGSVALLIFSLLTAWWYVAFELPKDKYESIVKYVLVAGCFYSVLAILQFCLAGFGHQTLGLLCRGCGDQVFGFPRINLFAAEPQFFANSMLLYFFVALGSFYYNRSRLALAGLVLSVVAIGLTFSRGANLGLLAGLITFYVCLRAQGMLRLRTLLLHGIVLSGAVILALLLLITAASYRYRGTPDIAYKVSRSLVQQASGGVINLPVSHAQQTGFQPNGFVKASSNDRLEAAKVGLKAWSFNLKNRLFGVGAGNLGPFVTRKIDKNLPNDLTIYIFYIFILSELGIIGLASFLVLMLSSAIGLMTRFWRTSNTSVYTALFALAIAYLAQFLFFGSYINATYVWLFFGIALGLGRKSNRRRV